MRVKPIPRRLLIHSVTYKELSGSDGWDGNWTDPGTVINNVRFVSLASNEFKTGDADSTKTIAMLIVDHVNSSAYPDFKTKSKVIFNGEDYIIDKVNRYNAFDDVPHHYELELIK